MNTSTKQLYKLFRVQLQGSSNSINLHFDNVVIADYKIRSFAQPSASRALPVPFLLT
jgi:hypothetical protein